MPAIYTRSQKESTAMDVTSLDSCNPLRVLLYMRESQLMFNKYNINKPHAYSTLSDSF